MTYRFLWLLIILAFISMTNLGISQSSFADTVVSPASTQYDASFLGRIIAGSNYREIWAEPVAMPVFYLRGSGFTIKELGGWYANKIITTFR